MKNTKHIEAYSFHEFLQAFQEAVLQGYRVDVETNEHFPQKYGDYLSAVVVADKPAENTSVQSQPVDSAVQTPVTEVAEQPAEVPAETTPAVKRTRKTAQ